ncbi:MULTISPECIES: hypothetical protein [Amycolatopsis]|uniref:Uncharacterized protein n=2 Tax=Amycolatopsis methanolica group TaxID=2893674 RepID=A0A076N0H0_AMYME|nr:MULTISPECIES: hypothetical protein [Amycolatopsis methanolica group]AIJ24360.1 hypothetical protein AMETH_4268 [Amycolatopsis methanolica 239]ROS43669.1 hypothetical protein EDD35_6089 [Amycolatopsis thermoflava]
MTWARHASEQQPETGPIAEARARMAQDEAIANHRAARTVADHALDVHDCRELLAMLGLTTKSAASAL